MSRNRRRDTRAELAVRSCLHKAGARFRVDYKVCAGTLSVRPDIVFTRWRIAVFVDGCFWHGCPAHGNMPARNRDYWVPKLQRNFARDRRVDTALADAGWLVIRVWEHEDPSTVAQRVIEHLDVARVRASR